MSTWYPKTFSAEDGKGKAHLQVPDEDDKPMALTSEEIEDIVDVIPEELAIDECSSRVARHGLQENLRAQLRSKRGEIAPSAKNIERIKRDILSYFYNARIQRGTSVGFSAAGISDKLTQMTFDTGKGRADAATSESGMKGIESILYAIKSRMSTCNVHFENIVSRRDIFDASARIVETKVSDFVADKLILPFDPNYSGEGEEVAPRYWWHDTYQEITGRVVPKTSFIMRITLNREKMCAHSVTPDDIARSLLRENIPKAESTKDGRPLMEVAYGPLHCGILDIIPDEEFIRSLWGNEARYRSQYQSRVFLNKAISPILHKARVSGIPGIEKMTPLYFTVNNLFTRVRLNVHELKVVEDRVLRTLRDANVDDPDWKKKVGYEKISRADVVTKGIPMDRVLKLITMSGAVIIKEESNFVGGLTRLLIYTPNGLKLSNHLNQYVQEYGESKDPMNEYVSGMGGRQWTKGEFIRLVYTYNFAFTTGTNLSELYKIPWINTARTVSSNMFEINSKLGIEATLMHIIVSLGTVLNRAGILVNSRHQILIADHMCTRGIPLGATYAGNTKQGKGVITVLTIERSMVVMLERAPYNPIEETTTAPAAIIAGSAIPSGSHAGKIYTTQEDINRMTKELEEEKMEKEMKKKYSDPGFLMSLQTNASVSTRRNVGDAVSTYFKSRSQEGDNLNQAVHGEDDEGGDLSATGTVAGENPILPKDINERVRTKIKRSDYVDARKTNTASDVDIPTTIIDGDTPLGITLTAGIAPSDRMSASVAKEGTALKKVVEQNLRKYADAIIPRASSTHTHIMDPPPPPLHPRQNRDLIDKIDAIYHEALPEMESNLSAMNIDLLGPQDNAAVSYTFGDSIDTLPDIGTFMNKLSSPTNVSLSPADSSLPPGGAKLSSKVAAQRYPAPKSKFTSTAPPLVTGSTVSERPNLTISGSRSPKSSAPPRYGAVKSSAPPRYGAVKSSAPPTVSNVKRPPRYAARGTNVTPPQTTSSSPKPQLPAFLQRAPNPQSSSSLSSSKKVKISKQIPDEEMPEDAYNILLTDLNRKVEKGERFEFERDNMWIQTDDNTIPYKRRLGLAKSAVGWGQLKLLIGEIATIVSYLDLKSIPNPKVVYVGAAGGHHIPWLVDLFPQIDQWDLWDPAKFAITEGPRIKIFNDRFTNEIAKKYTKEGPRIIFISDIRTIDPLATPENELEKKIAGDMSMQERWVMTIRPAISSLKLRLPYQNRHGASHTRYLSGDILYQPFRGPTSTECRLIVQIGEDNRDSDGNVIRPQQRIYDNTWYERVNFYHNAVIREGAKFNVPWVGYPNMPDQGELVNNYDGVYSIQTMGQYLDYIGWSAKVGTSDYQNQQKFLHALALLKSGIKSITEHRKYPLNLQILRNFYASMVENRVTETVTNSIFQGQRYNVVDGEIDLDDREVDLDPQNQVSNVIPSSQILTSALTRD